MLFSLINQWKLTDLTVKKIIFTDESVKGKITDSMSENLTDSDLESSNCNEILFWKSNYKDNELLFFLSK